MEYDNVCGKAYIIIIIHKRTIYNYYKLYIYICVFTFI